MKADRIAGAGRGIDEKRASDGVAAADDSIYLRTGIGLICVRERSRFRKPFRSARGGVLGSGNVVVHSLPFPSAADCSG